VKVKPISTTANKALSSLTMLVQCTIAKGKKMMKNSMERPKAEQTHSPGSVFTTNGNKCMLCFSRANMLL
jgi:hypothetical protein